MKRLTSWRIKYKRWRKNKTKKSWIEASIIKFFGRKNTIRREVAQLIIEKHNAVDFIANWLLHNLEENQWNSKESKKNQPFSNGGRRYNNDKSVTLDWIRSRYWKVLTKKKILNKKIELIIDSRDQLNNHLYLSKIMELTL